ncbi:calcium-binding protein [Okeania sp.]|uniref:calcium-binding protein n=1 Tax=Okeania sp. TaxID=3100323 RepID=UPI002B4AE664|nr:calcium-binding protein [Okeania sp.]MEB3343150.1 calcium-binding protein [Okeania sp.]
MSKSNQKPNKNKSQPDTGKLKPIIIDETIVSRKSAKVNGAENITINIPIEKFLQQIGAFQGMEDDDEAEQVHWEVFEQKLEEVLRTTDLEVDLTNLKKYLKYLKQNLTIPCLVTGTEEFEWEEYYTIGPGNKKEYQKEYQKLKKTQPSYTDEFNLLKLDSKFDVDYGILAVLERTTDQRKFTLPLADLETVAEDSTNSELLEDYSLWFYTYSE